MAKKLPGNSNDTSSALGYLKDHLTPSQKKSVLKEGLSGDAKTVLKKIDLFSPFEKLFGGEGVKKKPTLVALIGLLAWFLKPEKKEEKSESKKNSAEKLEDKVVLADILPKIEKKSEIKYADILPNAKPEQVLAAIQTNAKTLDGLYKRYKESKDPKELRYFLVRAIIAKESGYKTPVNVAARLINVRAINPRNRSGKFLKSKGIEFKMPKGSRSLIPNEKYLSSFEVFKDRVCSQLQPNVSGAKQIDNTAEILIRCAIGMGQVLAIHWIPGIKKASGIERLRIIYNFIKSGRGQMGTTVKLVNRLGKRYDWNPMYIAAAYYGGTGSGDRMRKDAQNPALHKKQAHGYGSISTYTNRVDGLVTRIIKDENRSA